MSRRFAATLTLSVVCAGPSHALTLGFGVEVEPFPFLSSSGPTNWVTEFDETKFEMLLNDAGLGNIFTSPTTTLDVTDVDGDFNVSFAPDGALTDTSSLFVSLINELTVGPITIPFPQELVAVVTAVEFDLLSTFGPTINFLMDVIPSETTTFFEDLFGQKLFGQIVLDDVDIGNPGFDRSMLFGDSIIANDIGASGVTGFFSMYRVKSTSGGGDTGGGGGGGDDISPVPLPASIPLLLAALGGFAWVRRRA